MTLQMPPPSTIVVSDTGEGLAQMLLDGRHSLIADESVASGGDDEGPDPYELLLMALGACTSITLRLYANRHQWPLERVVVELKHTRTHAKDCVESFEKSARLDHIDRVIERHGALDLAQRDRLLAIANHCPVHNSLTAGFTVSTSLRANPAC